MRKALFILITFIGVLNLDVLAQEGKNLFWIHSSFGGYTNTVNRYGTSATLGVSYVVKENIFSFRSNFYEEYGFSPNEFQNNVSILIGKYKVLKFGALSYSTGIGFAKGTKRGAYLYTTNGGFLISENTDVYEKHSYTKPSIPLEITYLYTLSKGISSGISLYSNLNTERNYLGIGIFFGLGKFKN